MLPKCGSSAKPSNVRSEPLVSELLHETVENTAVTLNRSICFSEDMLAKSLPCAKKDTESHARRDGIDAQGLFVSDTGYASISYPSTYYWHGWKSGTSCAPAACDVNVNSIIIIRGQARVPCQRLS
jgi:hypothetical protein